MQQAKNLQLHLDPSFLQQAEHQFTKSFLSDSDGNIVTFILSRGYLDISNPVCSDYYESALNLLTKIASNFPHALSNP